MQVVITYSRCKTSINILVYEAARLIRRLQEMIVKEVIIKNASGLMSKSAAMFIKKASSFRSNIWVEKEERKANAKSLLGLLSLGISVGTKIMLIVDGDDQEKAAEELEKHLSLLGE